MTKDEAKEAYRQAWIGWCLATKQETKRKLEQRMDSLQPSITRGPGPEWQAFAESLPGYVKFWEGWRDDAIARTTP
jgi:hypothetical protein